MKLEFPLIDPVAFTIGSLHIHWYGIAYMIGVIGGLFYARWIVQTPAVPFLTRRHIEDSIVWIVAGIIIGGRLGYALFYKFSYYWAQPWEILFIWHPGMAFHGGLIGVTIAMIAFCYRYSIPFLSLSDVIATVTPIGLFFGRIANFINGELFGRPTSVAWGVVFPHVDTLPRHPSQLYEAGLEGILLGSILFFLHWHGQARRYPGLLTGVFLLGYGIARTIVELWRQPDAHIGYLIGGTTWGQWLSVPLLIGGGFLIYRALSKKNLSTYSSH